MPILVRDKGSNDWRYPTHQELGDLKEWIRETSEEIDNWRWNLNLRPNITGFKLREIPIEAAWFEIR